MLGLFNIHHSNGDGSPKSHNHMNDISLGYSRDGFHWYRPDRRAFMGVSYDQRTDWNWDSVESAGGGLVVSEKLFLYQWC